MAPPSLPCQASLQRNLSEKDLSRVKDGGWVAATDGTNRAHQVVPTVDAVYNPHVDVSGVDGRRLMHKVNLRTMPWLAFLQLLVSLNRTSIGNAKLYRLEADLHLTDTQYLLCLTVFFISYSIFELPSNIFLKRLRPSIWLSTLMLLWGITMTLQGLITDFNGLIAIRWMLGTLDAGLSPGVAYYLSCWYKRSEFGIRLAIFVSAVTVSGAFGGLLAATISNMDGIGGKAAWAWIFIIEGLMTVVAGALSFWIIVDFPDNASFLTEAERTVVIRRLHGDNQFSAASECFQWESIVASLTDWKTYLYMVMSSANVVPSDALALFLPNIIAHLGYEATTANLLTVPVYVLAGTFTCIVGFLADRYGNRGLFNLGFLVISAAGYIILITSRNATLSYAAVYFVACGVHTCGANTIAWVGNNVQGTYKRGMSFGMIISAGSIQGVISSNVYRADQAPWYPLGHGILLMYICFGIITTIALRYLLQAENARRDRGERAEVIEGYDGGLEANGRFGSVEDAKRVKGDRWSGYRYVL